VSIGRLKISIIEFCGVVVWCGVLWCAVVCCGVLWCAVLCVCAVCVWCGAVWCGVVLCGTVCVVYNLQSIVNSQQSTESS
jgi:hypothetical protein